MNGARYITAHLGLQKLSNHGHMAAMLGFKRQPSSSFSFQILSLLRIIIINLLSRLVQSERMLDVITKPNEPVRTSASKVRTVYYISCMPLVLVSVSLGGFRSMKSCTDSLNLNISQ